MSYHRPKDYRTPRTPEVNPLAWLQQRHEALEERVADLEQTRTIERIVSAVMLSVRIGLLVRARRARR